MYNKIARPYHTTLNKAVNGFCQRHAKGDAIMAIHEVNSNPINGMHL